MEVKYAVAPCKIQLFCWIRSDRKMTPSWLGIGRLWWWWWSVGNHNNIISVIQLAKTIDDIAVTIEHTEDKYVYLGYRNKLNRCGQRTCVVPTAQRRPWRTCFVNNIYHLIVQDSTIFWIQNHTDFCFIKKINTY